ncbi:MAG: D-glycero-beta-D-manno-heptose 1-phosphate adenylyltransferase [Gemmatimonadota bacterium]
MRGGEERRVPGMGRVLARPALCATYGRPRDHRLVFTNGVFDLLHAGHIRCLEEARRLGDRLVVAVNSDASARRVKGRGRPFQTAGDRAVILAALRCVDAVTVFDEDTPLELIRKLLPDVLVKGSDYGPQEIVGGPDVLAAGGEVHVLPLVPERSTSRLVTRIRELSDD